MFRFDDTVAQRDCQEVSNRNADGERLSCTKVKNVEKDNHFQNRLVPSHLVQVWF